MRLLDAKAAIDALCAEAGGHAKNLQFGVKIYAPGELRQVPMADVKRIARDIDLGSFNVFVELTEDVTILSTGDREAIMTSVRRGGSWHAYQAHKRNTDRIAELEKQVAELKTALHGCGVQITKEVSPTPEKVVND